MPDLSPWHSANDLEEQLKRVEEIARTRGFSRPRPPQISASQLAELQTSIARPFPPDLYRFLAWLCQPEWSAFVHPDGFAFGVRAEDIGFHSVRTSEDRFLRNVRDEIGDVPERMPEWINAELITFGHSECDFEGLYYCVSSPEYKTGAILAGLEDDQHLFWIADSLTQWLARLVAFEGFESAFTPGAIPSHLDEYQRHFATEWNSRNPRSSWWRK